MRLLKHTLAAACLLLAMNALANLSPPVNVRLIDPGHAALDGEVFESVLEIQCEVPMLVGNFRFKGDGWDLLSLEAPDRSELLPGEVLQLPFQVRPQDSRETLHFEYEVAGHTYQKSLDLSQEHYDRMHSPQKVRIVLDEESSIPRSGGDDLTSPGFTPAEDAKRPEQGDGHNRRNIHVYGRFLYVRDNDSANIGADNIMVRIYDEDVTWDDLLAEDLTNSDGTFEFDIDWDPCWLCEDDPDIYAYFETENGAVWVQDATWEIEYSWETGVHDDYTGSNLNFGSIMSADEDLHPAIHINNSIVRAWRWLINNEGYDTDTVDVQWPDGSTSAWYNPFFEEIHVSTDREWREDTHIHEYGHHWVENYADVDNWPEYCNGWCDTEYTWWFDDCSHCQWCEENQEDAWGEGFPNWMADVITRSINSNYSNGVIFTRSQETLATCQEDPTNYHNSWITEGFLGAILRDIEDSGSEDNWSQATRTPVADGFGDVLSMGTNEIFDIADSVNPDDTSDFIWGFKAAYPNIAENLWETAMENDFNLDTANPSAPTNMSSSSHPVGTDSPDATPTFSWTRSTDDASGVGGYGVYITSSCSTPGQTQDIGDVTSWTSPALSPGTYYFNLRAVDRSGRWGSSSCYGPFTIREPEPANLEFTTPSGWNYSVVPRETDDASSGSAPNPVLLEGNTASTYWNLRGKNSGESSTSVGFTSLLTLDGSNQGWWASWSSIGSGGGFYGINIGPANIPGGRHTYGSVLDSDDVIAETDETDNRYAAQWIWSPYDLSEDLAVTRSAPPEMEGGWDDNVGVNWYNCDGFRFSSSSWWNAVLLTATDNADDYDCRLHEASTGAEDGFSTNLGYASRSAGYIDALIVNRNTVGNQNWDVGVLNESGGSSDFEITHVTESSHSYGDSLNVTMEDGEYLILREVGITASNVGPLSITLQVDPSEGPIHMRWYDEAFETGNLNASSEYDGTDSNGLARIDVEVTESGYYGLAIYRNPLDVNRGAVTFTVEVDLTPPDFLPYQFAGWHSPLVPRPADDGTNDSVALPDTLYGNEASTYLNIGVHNESPTGADGLLGKVYFDGVYSYWLAYPYFPGNANSPFNWSHAHTVRGGRHTLSLRLDDDETIEEISEENNIYGEQYVWSPLLLEDGVPLNRSIPPDRIGGWDEAPDGTSLWYNCDGLRLPNSGWWRAAAVLPSAGEDVDIRLHSALSGVKEGFKGSLAYSGWGPNSTDFVMANFNSVTNQSLDLGVLRIGDASGDYLAETVKSDYMGLNPAGTYSGFPLEDNRLLSLHEIGVSDSTYYGLRLVNHSDAKLGVSVYSADSDFRGKSQAMEGALAWLNGPGADEVITFTAAEAGYYCVAVWKAGAPDLHKTGTYDLHFVPGYQVDAGDAAPLGTGIAGVYPNPFNPKTTVRFTLKESAEAELAVYDIRGARVRQLQGGMLEAGSHHVEWDGKDSSGATVASGIYFIRLDAGGESYSRKAVLLK